MTRARVAVAIAAILGFVGGAIAVSALGTDRSVDTSETERAAGPTSSPQSAPELQTPEAGVAPPQSTPGIDADEEATAAPRDVLLIWTSGGLADGLASQVAAFPEVEQMSVVRAAELALVGVRNADGVDVESYVDGWHVPIDVLALDPSQHRSFTSAAASAQLHSLEPGQGLLSSTGAALRGGAEGLVMTFTSGPVEIVGEIDDASASGAELIVDLATGVSLGVRDERFLLVEHDGNRDRLQAAAIEALDTTGSATPFRFRAPAETTWMRHGDAVLPLAQIKRRYGEFAIRNGSGRDVEIDADWVAANIVEADVPVLGTVRCHRLVIDTVDAAMRDLVDRAITQVIDPTEFAGCFSPRRIGPGLPLSRHSWGIALDINVGDNPRGSITTQDPRLVDTMRTAGFTWGGSWLVPDPAHYEVIDTSPASP